MIQEVPKFHETFNSILEILADREIIHTREMQKRVIEKYYSQYLRIGISVGKRF